MNDGDSYRPSNGSEGDGFMENFCFHCEREREYQEYCDGDNPDGYNKACKILSMTMYVGDPSDSEYPEEWIYKDGKPVCTAFIEEGKELPYVDDQTLSLFSEDENESS